MITVHGRPNSSNVAKVMWAIGELGLPHRRLDVGGPFGGTDTPAYRALNPNGTIPTLEDDGFVLWESNAIVRYLAATYGRGTLWPDDVRVRADADRWMDWGAGVLAQCIDELRRAYRAAQPDEREVEVYRDHAGDVLGILDRHIGQRPFVAGDRLTMGDVALGALVHRWHLVPGARRATPNVTRWYEAMRGRAAFVTAIADVVS